MRTAVIPGVIALLALGAGLYSSHGSARSTRGEHLPPPQCWRLTWADEFSGDSLNIKKWTAVKSQDRGAGTWQPDHLRVANGAAEFRVSRVGGRLVSAGTQSRYVQQGGYFEMRARLPAAPGFRPAFWITTDRVNNAGDPARPTEIDVMEYPARNNRIRQNLHWNGYGLLHQTVGAATQEEIRPGMFHTFGLWWTATEYRFYVDRRLTWQSAGGGISRMPEFMRLGVEFMKEDANLLQASDEELRGSVPFTVDYVRTYQRKAC